MVWCKRRQVKIMKEKSFNNILISLRFARNRNKESNLWFCLIVIMKSGLWNRPSGIYNNMLVVSCWFSQRPPPLEKSRQLEMHSTFFSRVLVCVQRLWYSGVSGKERISWGLDSKASFSMKHLWDHLEVVSFPRTSLCTLPMCYRDNSSYPSLSLCLGVH